MSEEVIEQLLAEIRACRHCAADLPLGPRPVLQASATARLAICGQAPGTRVHETGIPFNDPSGDRLRAWMGIGRDVFYDPSRIAVISMGFCYPGRDRAGGDAPPRPECRALWHDRLFRALPNLALVLAVGIYAQAYHLGARRKGSLTATVEAWRDYAPAVIPLPHPSWRNNGWLKRHPWFEAELLPELRARAAALIAS